MDCRIFDAADDRVLLTGEKVGPSTDWERMQIELWGDFRSGRCQREWTQPGVYALIDPRDRLPHYIGSTGNLRKRMQQWSSKCQRITRRSDKLPVDCWLTELIRAYGDCPDVRILQVVDDPSARMRRPRSRDLSPRAHERRRAIVKVSLAHEKELRRVEAAWISYGFRRGWPLTNRGRPAILSR